MIEANTGMARCQFYRLLDHCLAPHEDGRVFGWRALDHFCRRIWIKFAFLYDNRATMRAGAMGVIG
ncbi:MAG TPA: hypothetical protein VFR86_20175 [Burkholderiaceae bacterium]|nr:hypothetical protein [Burkholderiaceae bacterium]